MIHTVWNKFKCVDCSKDFMEPQKAKLSDGKSTIITKDPERCNMCRERKARHDREKLIESNKENLTYMQEILMGAEATEEAEQE